MKEPGSGQLDLRVTVRIRNDGESDDGGLQSEFIEVAKRWAKVEPLGTAIYTGAKQTGDDLTHRITFRRVKGLDTRHEILCADGRLFRVRRATAMNGGRVYTVVDAEELENGEEGEGYV
jgi:head-tail adaptor